VTNLEHAQTRMAKLHNDLHQAELGVANLHAKVADYLNPRTPKVESFPTNALELNVQLGNDTSQIRALLIDALDCLEALQKGWDVIPILNTTEDQ